MRKHIALAAVAAILGTGALSAQESYDLSGDDVWIFNLAGEVEVVRGSGSSVVVEVMRGGADSDRLAVEVGDVEGRQALRVLYPSDEILYERMGRGSSTDVRVRRDGTFYRNGGGDRVRIRGRGDGLQAHADLRVHVPANRSIAVHLAVGEATATGLDANLLFDLGSAPARVTGIVGDVNVDTGSGSVDVSDVDGDVWVDTGSGSVELTDVRGDEVSVDTGSGSVIGSNVTAPVANFDTGSGRIEIDGIAARDVICDTGSGRVELRFTTDVDNLEVDTGSGSVALWLPADAGAQVEVDTGSGGIDIDVPLRVTSSARRHVEGELGDGEGRIEVDTGSGGVTIRSN